MLPVHSLANHGQEACHPDHPRRLGHQPRRSRQGRARRRRHPAGEHAVSRSALRGISVGPAERQRRRRRTCPPARWATARWGISTSARDASSIRTSRASTRRSRDGELRTNEVLQEAFAAARGHRLHLLGLVSDGGVHSHQDHLIALSKAARDAGVGDIMIHAITDGRDTSPTGGADFLAKVSAGIAGSGAQIATVIGRYFAMDRDKRWERSKLAWDAIVLGRGAASDLSPAAAIQQRYAAGETDEFLQPIILSHRDEPRVRDGDVVLFFNFRADRARQLSLAFLRPNFDGFDREVTPQIRFLTLTEYDETYGCPIVFGPQTLQRILGEVVSEAGTQAIAHRGNREVPARDLFLQRRDREAVSRRGSRDRAVAEGRADLRLQAGDERAGGHPQGPRAAGAIRSCHPQLRQPRHGRPHRRGEGRDQGGGDDRRRRAAGRDQDARAGRRPR